MQRLDYNEEHTNLNSLRAWRVDRFIPHRDYLMEMRERCWSRNEDCYETKNIWSLKDQQRKRYRSNLEKALGINPLNQQISGKCTEDYFKTWPCIPRSKSYFSTAGCILDLPTYSYATYPQLLDWSYNDVLVAALEYNYYIWSWRTQLKGFRGGTLKHIKSCKFDPHGKLLALGTSDSIIEIHNLVTEKIYYYQCQCSHIEVSKCVISAVDWSPNRNSFVTGCSNGLIASFSRNSPGDGDDPIAYKKSTKRPIFQIRISPDSRFVAAISVNSFYVYILQWPSLHWYNLLCHDWKAKALAWHPWRTALLAIGGITLNSEAKIEIWDTPPGISRGSCTGYSDCSIDAMLFNKISGELVVSVCDSDETGHLLILSDLNTVVDRWDSTSNLELGRIRSMIFNPNGDKLAIGTTKEDLIFFNFINKEEHDKKIRSYRSKSENVHSKFDLTLR